MEVSLEFDSISCECANPLFSYKYLRTHRSGSLKLIRCFPHCCPLHSYGNFCANGVALKATNALPTLSDVLVFARFQGSEEGVLVAGDYLDAQSILGNLRSVDNQKGVWIPSCSEPVSESSNDMFYIVNKNNEFGWHYGWIGSSTQAQRACSHHLVAYMVRHVHIGGKPMFQVVQSTVSPPFIVMSYRRACYFCQKHRTPPVNAQPKTECECEGEFNLKRSLPLTSTMNLPGSLSVCKTIDPATMERQLTILLAFLATPSVHFFAAQMPTFESRVLKSLLQPMGAVLSFTAYQRRAMIFPVNVLRPTPPNLPNSPDLESLKTFCLDLALAGLTYGALQHICSYFSSCTEHLLNREALHEAYLEWVKQSHQAITARLMPLNLSVSQLTAHVLHAAFQFEALQSVRTYVDAWDKLADVSTPGFDYFVAQLREVFMAEDMSTTPSAISMIGHSGRWMYDKTISVVYNHSMSPSLDLSLATLLRCITMGYSVQMYHNNNILRIKSDLQVFSTIWSEFILDGRPRVFRVFPNGESSLTRLAGLQHGDYIGQIRDGAVSLDFLSWSSSEFDARQALRVTVVLHQVKETALDVGISIGMTTITTSNDVDFMAIPAIERYATYNRDNEAAVANLKLGYNRVK
ncbi:Aste57867_188 [Aphanomyces stellatus]|uniref:Aste57867_188 protein n=1 Tax=Aphanomyces stellatus TaxID=120398 RepID=A0A485K751_9STRA|nr:hypothetical protein As57867_000188 [Aphanomyces stellatus]VFT77414.1 Aste57867_188 [Aphanomyces stellatus]